MIHCKLFVGASVFSPLYSMWRPVVFGGELEANISFNVCRVTCSLVVGSEVWNILEESVSIL